MDLENYISSGIIDAYVLGQVSDQERREVECMSKIYPEIKDELVKCQHALEMVAKSSAISPPTELKGQILRKIKSVKQEKGDLEGKVIAMDVNKSDEQKLSLTKIAAVLIIAILSGVLMFQISQSGKLSSDAELAKQEILESQKKIAELNVQVDELKKDNNIIFSSSTTQIKLAATDFQPAAEVRIFYNKNLKEAVMVSDKLDEPGELNQYQLWAIADGVPVDLGVISKGVDKEKFSVNIDQIDAFAITLEKNGGVESPTLENLVVIGKLTS